MTSAQRGNLGSVERDFSPGTNATKKDTDDGYWDGWIGVHGVGRTDNVVLYMEHLNDDDDGDGITTDDGVQDDEIVQDQIETHTWRGQEHSKLHLGELHWETNPDDRSDTPSPSMTFEVDYYAGADPALDTAAWRDAVEYNYELYGIDVEMQRGEVLSDADLVMTVLARDEQGNLTPTEVRNWTEPFSQWDLFRIEEKYHQTSGTQYFFVSTVADDDIDGGSTQTGIHRLHDRLIFGTSEFSTVFTDAHQGSLGTAPGSLSRDQKMRAVTAKTTVHEIGHVLDLGEEDDRNGEIYSGSTRRGETDYTPEQVLDGGSPIQRWSVMSRGINADNFVSPTNADYTAFSFEEWTTIDRGRLNP